jgi:hypothetical protein
MRIGSLELLEIVHRHLCHSHANVLCNGFNNGDEWKERTLEECAKAVHV